MNLVLAPNRTILYCKHGIRIQYLCNVSFNFLFKTLYSLVPESKMTQGQVSRSGHEQPEQHEICCGIGLEKLFEMYLES